MRRGTRDAGRGTWDVGREARDSDECLSIACLGDVRIARGGEPVTGFSSNKARALLVYLAVTGRPHSRAALAGMFWAELPEPDARMNLRRVLANLQSLVGQHLIVTRDQLAFDTASDWELDVAAFEAGLRRSEGGAPDAGAPASPLAQDRGGFLGGVFINDPPALGEGV